MALDRNCSDGHRSDDEKARARWDGGFVGGAAMSARDRTIGVALAVAVALIFTIGLGIAPFKAAGGLDCTGPFKGSKPRERATGFVFGREKSVCKRNGGSRLVIALLGGTLLASVCVAAVVAPESRIEKVLFGGGDPEDLYSR